MTIDILPTVAKLVGAELPPHKIDGLDIWPLLASVPGAKNPHDAYYLYYENNQLQAVMSGNWKLQLPHTYRTLAGQPGGRDGTPAPYQQRKLEQSELYDLDRDIGEAIDVAGQNPDKVNRLEALAELARAELGDSLTKRTGSGVREPGRIADSK